MDSTMTIAELEDTYTEDLSALSDWFLQYEYLIRLAKELTPFDQSLKTDANKVPGCQSGAWLKLREEDGKIYISVESEALIIKGILAVISSLLNGRTAAEICGYNPRFIEQTNIKRQISVDRFNGINSVIKKIKDFAAETQE